MAQLRELFQDADWKAEKHVPAIEAPAKIKKQETVSVTVTVGKEIPHPNTTEHHIRWIEIYFHPKGEKFPYQIGRFEFTAHGESVQGINTSTVYIHSLPSNAPLRRKNRGSSSPRPIATSTGCGRTLRNWA